MGTTYLETPRAKIDLGTLKKKRVHLFLFGHGNVGGQLIEQLRDQQKFLLEHRDIDLRVALIANSRQLCWQSGAVPTDWRQQLSETGEAYKLDALFRWAEKYPDEHRIFVDNTACEQLVLEYPKLVACGFHLISSNKIANTKSLSWYQNLRETLQRNHREYLYETNVGAGLPLVDTIKLLHDSGENITRIRGVFSGSLSYIFNEFSDSNIPFDQVVRKAMKKGYTEPDPREDLGGKDVARKLLILARELELSNELTEVQVHNLIPKNLRNGAAKDFLQQLDALNVPYHILRKNLGKDKVLRYIGDLFGDLSDTAGARLEVKLEAVPRNSMLGQLSGSDSLFEIFTESYGKHPIVIRGAGAGAAVTARGVFGDILRLTHKLN